MNDDRKERRLREATARDAAPLDSPESAPQEKLADPNRPPRPVDQVDEASMGSFPCSDPPGYYSSHG